MKPVRYGSALLIFFGLMLGASSLGWAQGQQMVFSATGDVPYGSSEISVFQQQMLDNNKYSPSAFLVHVGDILSGGAACNETVYSTAANIMKSLAVPAYITAGDNETVDCNAPAQGFSYFMKYFSNFEQNFCSAPYTERQSVRPENWAFTMNGVLFIGINLAYGGSSAQQQAADWVTQQFETKVSQVRAAAVFAHYTPGNFSTFSTPFRAAAAAFAKPVLFLHGHGHSWSTSYPFPEKNIFRVQVNKGGAEDPVEVTVTMDNSSPATAFLFKRNPWSSKTIVNMPPCANAGPDQMIASTSTSLSGGVGDDGDPASGTLTKSWSKVSGPGAVTFGNASSLTTSVSFGSPGVYVLRLTANDSQLQSSDDVEITVQGAVSPVLAIDDVILNEGNSGTTEAIFTVSLASTDGSTVTVDYQVVAGTATEGDDYTPSASSGTLTFSGATTTQTISVTINGDVNDEMQDETFFVNLSNPSNATISDDQGQGTIVNDDAVTPPTAPANLMAKTTGTATVDLSWSDQSNNEDGFKIERKSGNGTFTEITTVGANANSYNDLGLNASTVYTYQVRAFKASVNSAYSNASATETGSGIVASPGTNLALSKSGSASTTNSSYPVANAFDGNTSSTYWRSNSVSSGVAEWLRVDLGVVQTVGRAVIRWNSSYFAKSYQLQVSNNNVDWTTVYSTTSGVTGNADFSFTPTLARYVRVYMTLNNGSTYRIYEFEVYSGPTPPPMPTLAINDVSMNEGNSGTTNAVFAVTLTGASVGTATVDYQVVAGTATEGDDYTASPSSGTLTFSGSTTSQTITVAIKGDVTDEGQNETFFVNLSNATNAAITDVQGQGTIVNDDMPVPPIAPANLLAKTTGTATIDLTWSDQSNNEDGFKIERKSGSSSFSEIGTVGADANSYSDSGLNASTVYTYQVRAFKASANSAYSNTSATETGSGIVASPGTNVALSKSGSASTTNSSYPVVNAFDGNTTSTYWRSNSVASGVAEWLRVDLGSVQTVGRAVIRWNSSYFAKSYELQVSNNNVDWTTAYSKTGGIAGNADFSFTPVLARYVRVYMTLNNSGTYRIYEFEVYSGPTPPPGPTFALTVNTSGSGSVALNPSGGTYSANTVITLTASPAAGFQFSGWSGDLTGTDNPTTITMDANKNVTASFTALPLNQYTLTVNTSGSGSVALDPAGGTYDTGTVVTLTPQSGAGYQFAGWSGDLSGSTNPATITMDADKSVTATFTASSGSGQVVFEEIKTGGSSSSTTVATSANLTGVSGHLYLAAIAKKSNAAVSSVSGLGLSWTRVKGQCSGRGQTGVDVWMAQGTPSGNGIVTATLAAVPSNAVIAVSRYSGVDAVDPIGNIISGNTTGANGACTGGTDNAAYSFNLNTSVNGAVIYGAATMRNHIHTPGAGYTERAEIMQGSSAGSQASVAVQDKSVASTGTVVVDGTFDSSVDWSVVALEIKPQITLSKNSRVVDNTTPPATPTAFHLDPSYPNPVKTSAQIRFSLPQSVHVTIKVYTLNGAEVKTLSDGEYPAGFHAVTFNAGNLPSGAYFYVMQAGGVRQVRQFMLIK